MPTASDELSHLRDEPSPLVRTVGAPHTASHLQHDSSVPQNQNANVLSENILRKIRQNTF